jgi:hypothetical protein
VIITKYYIIFKKGGQAYSKRSFSRDFYSSFSFDGSLHVVEKIIRREIT